MFQNLIKAEVQGSMLKEAYEILGHAYEALDKSHEDYMNLDDKAMIMAECNYLEEPFQLYSEAQVVYFQVSDKRKKAQSLRNSR